jgi:hypothetical protein
LQLLSVGANGVALRLDDPRLHARALRERPVRDLLDERDAVVGVFLNVSST